MKREIVTVEFTACCSSDDDTSINVVVPQVDPNDEFFIADDQDEEIIRKAVEKIYGKNCWWHPNSELDGYGQVFESLRPTKNNSNPGNSSRTNRMRVDIIR